MDRGREEMKLKYLSVKSLCLLIGTGTLLFMLLFTVLLSVFTSDKNILLCGAVLTICALTGLLLLVFLFSKRLSLFTNDLCRTLDGMISGNGEPERLNDSETLFARINHRLSRLYNIMQENKRKVDAERVELQMLVSDISHQVKMPVANLKMVTDTLLSKPVTETERVDFLHGIHSQTDKLNFLFHNACFY